MMNTNTEDLTSQHPIEYHGKLGEIYKLWIFNLILSILTLGIYSFWGKTRMRRYLISSCSLVQDRFEYAGHGKELFFGFVKALLVLILIIVPFILSQAYIRSEVDQNLTQEQMEEQKKKIKEDPSIIIDMFVDMYTKEAPQGQGEDQSRTIRYDLVMAATLNFFILLVFIFYLPPLAKYSALHYRFSRLGATYMARRLSMGLFIAFIRW